MSNTLTRIAAGAAALLLSAAATNVALQAQTSGGAGVPAISTECGAGTITYCGDKATTTCDWDFDLGFFPLGNGWVIPTLKLKRDCEATGMMKLYKDKYPPEYYMGCTGSTTTTGGNEPIAPEECI